MDFCLSVVTVLAVDHTENREGEGFTTAETDLLAKLESSLVIASCLLAITLPQLDKSQIIQCPRFARSVADVAEKFQGVLM